MTGGGVEALALSLIGVHSAIAHHELVEAVELVRAVGSSYRLACSEPGSGLLQGRVAINFCRAVVAGLAHQGAPETIADDGLPQAHATGCA